MKLSVTSFKNRVKSAWLDLNRKIQVTHLLDYPAHRIYMCDNVRIGSCEKEPDTVRWIETFKKDEIAYDIGANVGAYSLVMSVYAAKVYAFEPAVMNYALLCKNIIENVKRGTLQSNIIPINIALAEKTGMNHLNYINFNPGKSGHQIDGRETDGFGNKFLPVFNQEIMGFDLDSFIEVFQSPVPNHIKIDVDGVELEILRGAPKLLANAALRSLWVEIESGSESEAEITALLARSGFGLSARHHASERFYNYHFIRNEGRKV